jgi:tripeptide aminopeptidase
MPTWDEMKSHHLQSDITEITVNVERLAQTFMDLVRIDSISREERAIADALCARLAQLGAQVFVDDAWTRIGGSTGNLIARFNGNRTGDALLLSAHMDTVEPGRGIEPQLIEGIFTSAGDTVLGADDKSALAIILEVLECIREHDLPCAPLEIVFTIGEEIGLLGAKHLDYSMITARQGYVLDTRNPQAVVTRAPAANRLMFRIFGQAAHAGSSPEKGINAISLAGKAIARLELGRIDHETTCNIGTIEGGLATNIIPDRVTVSGEVRSHDRDKLQRVTAEIVSAFEQVISEYRNQTLAVKPRLETEVRHEYDLVNIAQDHPLVKRAVQAAANMDRRMDCATSGGGSDANIFAQKGIDAVVLGTGMQNVHTVDESIRLADMISSALLLLEIIRLHADSFEAAPEV